MRYRKPMTRRGSKRLFTATALKQHSLNASAPMRGGIRL